MREVLGDIRDSQFREICDLIEDAGLEHEFTILTHSMTIIHKKTRNRIIAKGFKKSAGNQTAKVKSIKDPTDIWVEEADEINHSDFIKADTSVRTKKVDIVRIWLTFNPEDEDSWIKKVFIDQDRDDTTLVHTTYLDNLENLQESYIKTLENLKTEDPEFYAVYVLGQWGVKKVIRPFAERFVKGKHEAKVNFNPQYPVHFSIDFNYEPFGLIAFQMWKDKSGEHCHIIREFAISGGTIKKMADEIRAYFGQHLSLSKFTGDYGGTHKKIGLTDNKSLFIQLREELGLHKKQFILKSNPTHKLSRSDCNDFLLYYPDFKINPIECPGLTRDMRVVEVDALGSIIKRNRKDKNQLADHLDCFRYMVNTHFKDWLKRNRKKLGIKR